MCGHTLGDLAARIDRPVPTELRRAKGWVGQLIEALLGAHHTSAPGPDLPALGIEIKTVPIDSKGRPRESTWVCSAPLGADADCDWLRSPPKAKLARVLWMPVQAAPDLKIAERRVGSCLLWSPNSAQERILRDDWNDLAGLIAAGWAQSATAHRGTALQLRPKAADASITAWGIDNEGAPIRVRPLGFYLRRPFVEKILAHHFQMTGG